MLNKINSCNGFYCDVFTPNKPYKPAIWTEAWSGWVTEFGGPIFERPVKDLTFSVAKFLQNGGSFVNYYMYHGGTNFGRSAGGPFITTSYDYDAPLDEYGLIRQPKYNHLKELHKAVKLCEKALVSVDPKVTSLGNLQRAHVYSSESGDCAAFLSNYDTNSSAKVMFNNMHYSLPPWSISILPDCKTVAFNTAKVGVQTSRLDMLPSNNKMSSWETYNEDLNPSDDGSTFSAVGLLEQINVTRDASDYLWCTTSIDVDSSESFLHSGELPTLIIQSAGHTLHVFVNGELCGSAFGTREKKRFTFQGEINLRARSNKSNLLSVAVGLPNVGGHFETYMTGVQPPNVLHGLDRGKLDLSWVKWTYKVGLMGEKMNLVSPNSVASVDWTKGSLISQKDQPLAWHKPPKCQICCGKPAQRWYHLPRSWLKSTQNLLVLFEELGGQSLSSRGNDRTQVFHQPKIHLHCGTGQSISSIKFASSGTPLGICGSFQQGTCHAPTSYGILDKKCIGKQRCSVTVSNSNFVKDPCPNVFKRLSVEALCAPRK
ncbi:Beta-galactosidase 3 [Salvia divinorum]|uniref:beta-galactosidase n=1 Tax=Salvia divinorum TaxID=28513 RepID=A0ABD1INT6_SALDI